MLPGGLIARRVWGGAWLAALVGCALLAPVASAQGCANEARRVEQGSTYLPDCRAYELASPPGSQPSSPLCTGCGTGGLIKGPGGVQASATGDDIAFFSYYDFPGDAGEGPFYLSTRGQNGWSTVGVIPPQSPGSNNVCNPFMAPYSPDLSAGVLADGFGQTQQEQGLGQPLCGSDDPPLVAGEPRGYQNLFVRDDATGSYQLVNVTPAGVAPASAGFQAASTDLGRVVFDEPAKLTPDAPAPPNLDANVPPYGQVPVDDLYEWSAGTVRLVSVLPDGTPVLGMVANGNKVVGSLGPLGVGAEVYTHAVSADGSRVFFVANGNLYVRENAEQEQSALTPGSMLVNGEQCIEREKACTIEIDASQAGGSGGGGTFQWASSDGSVVYFTDDSSAGLTANTTPGSGQNLYEYDLESGRLTDITTGSDAQVLGTSGTSEAGSYVYFVAEGELEGTHGASAGEPNLYLYHAGALTFIATLDPSRDYSDWNVSPAGFQLSARVSPNGLYLGFTSVESLTGYDNVPTNLAACDDSSQPTGAPCREIFLYDAASGRLNCVSCDPSGASPTGPAVIDSPSNRGDLNYGPPGYLNRQILDDGRVFFDSPDPLVSAASNGRENVYEYEDGQLYLISTGTSPDNSAFYDASASGNDVFFVTSQRLVPSDTDNANSIYDARVEGGFPEPPAAPQPCAGEGCRGSGEGIAAFAPPASASLSSPGNLPALVEPVKPVAASRPLTRAQRLARTLKACRKQPKRRRRACERDARRRYRRVARRTRR
jgi:hypothetical protein